MFNIQKFSNHGTSNPIIARLHIQPTAILELHEITVDLKEKVKNHFFEISRHLLRCYEIEQYINESIQTGISTGVKVQQPSGAQTIPTVLNLHFNLSHSYNQVSRQFVILPNF